MWAGPWCYLPIIPMKNRVQTGIKNIPVNGLVETGMILIWVQCKEYRCLAYTDATGQWINFYTGEKLMDFVKVID